MTDSEKVSLYLLLKIEDVPLAERRVGRSAISRVRKAIHDAVSPEDRLTEIVLSSERTETVYGLDQTADLAVVSEMVEKHITHAQAAMRSRRRLMSFEDRLAEAQRTEARFARREDGQEPRPLEIFTVWIEGYAATGQSGEATSKTLYGFDLNDALERWRDRDDPEAHTFLRRDPDPARTIGDSYTGWSFWGCRIYTNESDARRSFG